ncbi:MAG: MFS transporter [Oscillospiraceae bacterium]|jgi:Na+/melibiose symporter-like transporter|nr:MFS transporter [Oscillospiraceae bacterium]
MGEAQETRREVSAIDRTRRYVGTKETVGFVLYDVAQTFNISSHNAEFTNRILNIDMGLQAAIRPFTLAWDVLNDLFIATLVDRTRTRFGKFRPYLILYPFYGIPMSAMFYVLPYLFLGTDAFSISKLLTNAVLGMFNDLTGTVIAMVRTGMIANLTPSSQERITLLTKSNFFSMFGEELPGQIFKIILDVVANNKSATQKAITEKMRGWFLWFGVGCTVVSGAFSFYFALVSKERVYGSENAREKPPGVRETLQGLLRNRPLFMMTLAEILSSFGLRDQRALYSDSVLNFRNFGAVFGLPGVVPSYVSYAYVPKLRERFSTKSLWILTSHMDHALLIPIYFLGMINGNYRKLMPMLIFFGASNTLQMFLYGAKKVIPEEIRNECIDYGEWKNGFRSEGLTGALRELPKKITTGISDTVTTAVMKGIGFETGDNFARQSDRVAHGIFALSTILPSVFGLLGIVPKLFYNINQHDRERMYQELSERRAAVAENAEGK